MFNRLNREKFFNKELNEEEEDDDNEADFEKRVFHSLRVKPLKKSLFSTLLKWAFGLVFLCIAGVLTALTLLYLHINSDLPKINKLADYRPPTVTNIFSDNGTKIGEFYKERRIVLPITAMPPALINAFVAAEDSRFREHVGIDLIGIIRAFIKNMQAGSIVQGGSTITQQVTKSFLLTPERTYKRKIKEAILAYRIDKTFSKDDILFLYLNQIYLGHGAYGVEAAAQNYFGKHANELNLAECAMLAGLPQAPSRYSPFKHPELAKERQLYVLKRMQEEGYISTDEMNQAMAVNLDIQPRKNFFSETVPWYTEYIRRYAIEKYGEDMIYNQGINIYTAVNIEFQKMAENAVERGLQELEKRHGYGGTLKNVSSLGIDSFSRKIAASLPNGGILEDGKIYKGVITDIDIENDSAGVKVGKNSGFINLKGTAWSNIGNLNKVKEESEQVEDSESSSKTEVPKKSLKIGDVVLVKALNLADKGKSEDDVVNSGKIDKVDNLKKVNWEFALELEPEVEGALISIEADTGYVKAMVGGRNYHTSQFNRAVQSRRQPGSAFKPIIYAAALDKGYTTSSIIIDSPIAFKDGSNKVWKPQNYSETFYGPTRLREALVKSRNVVTVKIVQDIGVDYVIEYARKLGITSPMEKNLSIALGSCGISLLELVRAYTVFSNLGYLVEPVFITKIVDRDNNVIEEAKPKKENVIDMATAYIMTSMMESVVQSGTATKAKELGRPAACKTGTTNDMNDALFVGYTPQYTTGVWVGFDKKKSLGKGESGARSAIPIWLEYMKGALEGTPVMEFNVPEGVVFHNVDPHSGLLSDSEYGVINECFKEGVLPTRRVIESAGEIEEQDIPVTEQEDFFKSDI
ncbi:MAG: PBP1A family penicillin-binding protein [Desulfamplus sp.]|nr:PBP1A family penicillin-binding protein [Desulfamplus sp.]